MTDKLPHTNFRTVPDIEPHMRDQGIRLDPATVAIDFR